MSNGDSPPRFDTRAIGVGEDPREHAERDVVSPIHLSTTYIHDDLANSKGGYHYTRSANPTRAALEDRLSSLENGTDALATAAGMGAIGTVAMTLLEPVTTSSRSIPSTPERASFSTTYMSPRSASMWSTWMPRRRPLSPTPSLRRRSSSGLRARQIPC